MARSFKWIYANLCLCRWCPGVARRRAERKKRRALQMQRHYDEEEAEEEEEEEEEESESGDSSSRVSNCFVCGTCVATQLHCAVVFSVRAF